MSSSLFLELELGWSLVMAVMWSFIVDSSDLGSINFQSPK